MPHLGQKSNNALSTTHRDIQTIMRKAILFYDFSVTEGKRSQDRQFEFWQKGRKLKKNADQYLRKSWKVEDQGAVVTTKDGYEKMSIHQMGPVSEAIDVVPYPSMWSNDYKFHELAGVIKTVQQQLLADDQIERTLDWGFDLWAWDFPHWQLT